MKRIYIAFLCIGAYLLPSVVSAQVSEVDARAAWQALEVWNTEKARRILAPHIDTTTADTNLNVLVANLFYLEGQYSEAVKRYEKIPEDILAQGMLAKRFQQAKKTEETLRPFSEHKTDDGRFLIRFSGKDKILLPYLVDVLLRAESALSEDFGYTPSYPILVEVYPTVEYLAAVSSLTTKDLKTSGTIALCSDNKLMLTSPRGLGRGYGWRDTIAHEFVHYFVTKVSNNTVPIWLHEGIAKFQETRWRSPPGHQLAPPQEDLLARSIEANKLVTFEQMHPSMALLPSQEAAALAFAEVHSTIEFLHQRGGYPKFRKLLKQLAAGGSLDDALRKTYGFNLVGLWSSWLDRTRKMGLRTYPGLVQMPLTFVTPDNPEEDVEAALMTIKEKKVKDWTHLGELLRARNRPHAAAVEYRKAMNMQGRGNPAIQNGLAKSLLELEKPAEVIELMDVVLKYYPEHGRTHLNLGRAYLKLEKWEQARNAFETMIGINPFHPEVHESLIKIYTKLGMTEKRTQAKQAQDILQRETL